MPGGMVPGVESPAGAAGRKRLRILVAGTSDAIDTLTRTLHHDADIVPARSVSEALGVETFIDIPQLTEQYGEQVALEALRQVLLRGGV